MRDDANGASGDSALSPVEELNQLGKMHRRRLPDALGNDSPVVVREHVAETNDSLPRDLVVFVAKLTRQVACGLADDLKPPFKDRLDVRVTEECLLSCPGGSSMSMSTWVRISQR